MSLNGCQTLIFVFLFATLSISTNAEVFFKCKNQQGRIEFSDKPCFGESSSQSVVSIRENTLNSAAERKHYQQAANDNANSVGRKAVVIANPEARPINISTCTQAKQDWVEAKKNAKCWATSTCETESTRELAKRVDRFCNRNVDEMSSKQLQHEANLKKEDEERKERESTHPKERESTHPKIITSCDRGGCWDTSGNRYNAGGGNTFFSSKGVCHKTGNQMQCP